MLTGNDSNRGTLPRTYLSEDVADYVRELVLTGCLRPGAPLLPSQLAAQLDISPTPARAGLVSLKREGFLGHSARRGFYVDPIGAQEIQEAYSAHALIAGELAARASQVVTPVQLHVLVGLQGAMRSAADRNDTDRLDAANADFHRQLYRVAKAPWLVSCLRPVLKYVPRRFFFAVPTWLPEALCQHDGIVESLAQRDAQSARLAVQEHMTRAGTVLAEHLASAGTPHHFDGSGSRPRVVRLGETPTMGRMHADR